MGLDSCHKYIESMTGCAKNIFFISYSSSSTRVQLVSNAFQFILYNKISHSFNIITLLCSRKCETISDNNEPARPPTPGVGFFVVRCNFFESKSCKDNTVFDHVCEVLVVADGSCRSDLPILALTDFVKIFFSYIRTHIRFSFL